MAITMCAHRYYKKTAVRALLYDWQLSVWVIAIFSQSDATVEGMIHPGKASEYAYRIQVLDTPALQSAYAPQHASITASLISFLFSALRGE